MAHASTARLAISPLPAGSLSPAVARSQHVRQLSTYQGLRLSLTTAHGSRSTPLSSTANESVPRGVGRARRHASSTRAATGFGESTKRGGGPVLTRDKDLQGWTKVAAAEEVVAGKNKAVIVKGKGYVVVKEGEALYGVEANCPACQFPMIQGKVEVKDSAVIQCPLCHSSFSLATGESKEWCPKDGPVTFVIGTLKRAVPKENAKVYKAAQSESGQIYLLLKKPS